MLSIKILNLNTIRHKSYLKYLYGNWKLKDKFYKNILAKKKPYLFHPFIKTKV